MWNIFGNCISWTFLSMYSVTPPLLLLVGHKFELKCNIQVSQILPVKLCLPVVTLAHNMITLFHLCHMIFYSLTRVPLMSHEFLNMSICHMSYYPVTCDFLLWNCHMNLFHSVTLSHEFLFCHSVKCLQLCHLYKPPLLVTEQHDFWPQPLWKVFIWNGERGRLALTGRNQLVRKGGQHQGGPFHSRPTICTIIATKSVHLNQNWETLIETNQKNQPFGNLDPQDVKRRHIQGPFYWELTFCTMAHDYG